MADPTKSLFQRLMERRQAIEAGDPTAGAVAMGARDNSAPPPAAPPKPGMKSKAAAALTQRPGEAASAFRLRQINAAADAGEL